MRIFSTNRKANYEYTVLDTFEAGMVLHGSEVKSIRANKMSIKEAYVKIINGEVFLINSNVAKPPTINTYTAQLHVEQRPRKLLMKKKEIKKLEKELREAGLTLIPLKVYQRVKSKVIKIEIALARGKKLHDKRETIKQRDLSRELQQKFRMK